MKSTAASVVTLVLLLAGGIPNLGTKTPLAHQAPRGGKSTEDLYDGSWWLAKEVDEREAFLDGVDDCLTWVAHVKGLLGTGDQLEEKITRYYRTHPSERTVPVLEVCRKVGRESPPPKPTRGGEVWTNPHWYLNGTYWSQLYYDAARQAFLEGYLSCLRTCVSKPTETYSRPAAYYVRKITKYIEAHPKTAYNEAIANILRRFRDSADQEEGPSVRSRQ